MRLPNPAARDPRDARLHGVVYLLHFATPYEHARHYMGFTADLAERLREHRRGYGSRLVGVVAAAGIEFNVVRAWHGTRSDERRLKGRGLGDLCPICRASSGCHPRNPRWTAGELTPDEIRLALIHAAA